MGPIPSVTPETPGDDSAGDLRRRSVRDGTKFTSASTMPAIAVAKNAPDDVQLTRRDARSARRASSIWLASGVSSRRLSWIAQLVIIVAKSAVSSVSRRWSAA